MDVREVLLPGVVSLAVFAYLLTLVEASAAGRAYAAYGGIYIAASLVWLWSVEGWIPDRWDHRGGHRRRRRVDHSVHAPLSINRPLSRRAAHSLP